MEIAQVPVGTGEAGLIVGPCPGLGGGLAADLARLRAAGAVASLSLLDDAELARLGVAGLGEAARMAGLVWLQAPLADMGVPAAAFLRAWAACRPLVHAWLDEGRHVHLHCRAGLGRAGTVAALILVERGWTPEGAVAWVRAHRPGAVETAAQVAFVAAWPEAGGRPWPEV